MIKLYGNPYSRANRVRWTLEEVGATYEEEKVSLGKDGTRSASFLKINPNGHVPVIDDGGFILFESVPICFYIAKKYGTKSLWGANVVAEAAILQWSMWAVTELEKAIETASLHTVWLPKEARSSEKATKAREDIGKCLDILKSTLDRHGFAAGDHFSLADVIISEVSTSLVHTGIDMQKYPEIQAYLTKTLSRSAAQKALASDISKPFLH